MHRFTRTAATMIAGVLAALAVPAAAQAAAAPVIVSSTASGGMTYAGTDAINHVTITLTGTTYTVDDIVSIQANAGCSAVAGDATKVTCTAFKLPDGTFKRFNVFLRGSDDTVTNATAVGMNAHGDDGDDKLLGGSGADGLHGGAGDQDVVDGGAGADDLGGGPGVHDIVDYVRATGAVSVDLTRTAALDGQPNENDLVGNVESIGGGKFSDILVGDDQDNLLVGSFGDDWLVGNTGADSLVGGSGFDVLLSNEELFGPLADGAVDQLSGGSETDTCGGSTTDGDLKKGCEQ